MELNNVLYNKLYSYANWLIRDEDVAADAVNNVFLNYNSYTGSTTQEFYTWANVIIHRKKIDHWRKKAKEKILLATGDFSFDNLLDEPTIEETNLYQLFSPYLTKSEVDWMIKYWSDPKKINADKIKFFYLKERFLKKKTKFNDKKYLLINLETKEEIEFNTHKQIAEHLDCTSEAIRLAFNENRKIKNHLIKLNHK